MLWLTCTGASLLSAEPPRIASIAEAKHLVQFGHKYGVWVLLDEGDAFINKWCMTHLNSNTHGRHLHDCDCEQHAIRAAQEVAEWIAFAEGASLRSTLVVCETWFVPHIWDLTLSLKKDPLSDILAQISSHVLARIMSAVAHKNRLFIR